MIEVQDNLEEQFKAFVSQQGFPCSGAKTALHRDQITVRQFDDIRCDKNNIDILVELYQFVEAFDINRHMYSSFICAFEQPDDLSEKQFERALWNKLQQLHDIDVKLHPWDRKVSNDPASENFSFSLGGKGFFIIGLNPNSQRRSRRFVAPAIVFNLHMQFDYLREKNKFENFRNHIRKKDAEFCGDRNSMLSNHGDESEVRQYSGRKLEPEWECPFKPRN
ncbi:YqcI/YcgG family protein [Alteromonas pelagimontana]|uniref:YqcI/YcgG family protein n=1 Tax=Alteromonas pelagimontana TaxID=1858656 RepID=A0A6M4MFJ7_9ALTE|nr:guanitoxin biosynthesis heme-dependent pre-guanitoxin N-hydroxylase GntA [Alteromonas pelagimontana]QJR81658.1 YqcI/YcgG family protein [Alteromonas pelagimontana]